MLKRNMSNQSENEIENLRYELLGSFLKFTQTFYFLRTGRTFDLSNPPGRESHYLTIMRALVDIHRGSNELQHLLINVAPRSGKTELLIHFISWSMAHKATCNFIYTSYSKELATKQTGTVKQIMEMRQYQALFDARINRDSRAKDRFETTVGGSIYAAGTGGTITRRGAGIKGDDTFGGAVIIDDSIKPDEASSDTIREGINNWSDNTLVSRLNNPGKTPIIFIGQRTHELDLPAKYKREGTFKEIVIPSLDQYDNPIHPEMHSKQMLLEMKAKMPYVFASQYQQDPQPAGGALFKEEWFRCFEIEPEILMTFFTVDTAESEKSWADATVFSFWGIYEIMRNHNPTGEYGLHWLNCLEDWIEAADLEDRFFDFFAQCSNHKIKPKTVIIEKKSTGVTLSGILKKMQGILTFPIERTRASGSKTDRYIEMQPIIAQGYVSLPINGEHTSHVIKHMSKITANRTHALSDIADSAYDAVKAVYIDKTLLINLTKSHTNSSQSSKMTMRQRRIQSARAKAYGLG